MLIVVVRVDPFMIFTLNSPEYRSDDLVFETRTLDCHIVRESYYGYVLVQTLGEISTRDSTESREWWIPN